MIQRILLDVHDDRDEERDNRHKDAGGAADQVPGPDPEPVRYWSGDKKAERRHGRGSSADQRHYTALHVGVHSGLKDGT